MVEPDSEERRLLESFKAEPITIGSICTYCQFYPQELFNADRGHWLFIDDYTGEKPNRLQVVYRTDVPIPVDSETYRKEIEESLMGELSKTQRELCTKILQEIDKTGECGYPRVVAKPKTIEGKHLEISLAPSLYGLHLVHHMAIPLDSVVKAAENHCLTSLGVRTVYIYEDRSDGKKYCLFHRRSAQNADYIGAWDIGAAGYINPSVHVFPEGTSRLSPFACARDEIREELKILSLPDFGDFQFFGVTRNTVSPFISLVGQVKANSPPDLRRINQQLGKRVECVERCELKPEKIAKFMTEKRYWTPEAILPAVLTLEANGFNLPSIEEAFSKQVGLSDIELRPFQGWAQKFRTGHKKELDELVRKFSGTKNREAIIRFLIQVERLEQVETLLMLTKNLVYVTNDNQVNAFRKFFYEQLDEETRRRIFFTSFFSLDESQHYVSFILAKSLKKSEVEGHTSPDLITLSKGRNPKDTVVLFVDNVIMSGTQLSDALEELLKVKRTRDRMLAIENVDQETINWLRETSLVYWTFIGTREGIRSIEEKAKSQGLHLKAHAAEYLDRKAFEVDSFGVNQVFGNQLDKMEKAKKLCQEIGYQLFQDKNWPEDERKERSLGYGNMQRLIIFEPPLNSPKATLPIFWKAGKYNGKPWIPLFPRSD